MADLEGETPNIMDAIFAGTQFDFSETVNSEYFAKLGKCTFEQILSEPSRLNDETKTLTEQTQELALANYRTFVETADCSNRILKDFNTSKSSLDEVITKMPNLISECENFANVSKNIIKDRGCNDQIQYQSEQLLGILELPTIMQTALNQGDYESALDLYSYIRNLSRRYNDLEAIQNITSEVTKLWFETLHHLFNQLRCDLPLPQCLQVLGYLRRANAVYESAMDESNSNLSEMDSGYQIKTNKIRSVGDGLQLHFLKARGAWFDTALTEATNEENEKHLRKIVELHRINLFNILTQHKAIFLSDTQGAKLKSDDLNGMAALSCWLKDKVNRLINILQQNASQEDEASLESLINQCMYLCLSFGRVGADMRAVVSPLFRDIIANEFTKSLRKADTQFEIEMKHYKLINRKIPRRAPADSEPNQNAPPENLLDFYPLAEYCNGLLTALNGLRVVAPLCLARHVLSDLSQSLTSVSKVLSAYYHREQQAFSPQEKEFFVANCNLFADELIPYIQKCIYQVFSPATLADQLGISLAAVQEEKLLSFDTENICSFVNEILTMLNL